MTTLVVTAAFPPYGQGATITDPATVAVILAGPNAARVVKVDDGAGGSGTGGGSGGGSGSGSGSGSSSGLAPVSYPLAGVTSYAATHAFPYPPRAWLIDATGAEVETDVAYAGQQVIVTFPTPFTGTLWLG